MTNYEKYSNDITEFLVTGAQCINLLRLRGLEKNCSKQLCSECEAELREWLNSEAVEFDPAKLNTGDKIIMRKYWEADFYEYEVICNKFPTCWLRMRKQKDGTFESDSDFLIFYDDLIEKYEVKGVIKCEGL